MPNLFARQTALTNVGGRIDYISNPARQEHLLAVYDGAADLVAGTYWRQLAQECKAASKHATPGSKCCQGRELTLQLSNALLQRMAPEQIAETLAKSFEEQYGRPCMVAVHYNKNMSNLHAHLIYSERALLAQPIEKTAPRALFFDETGKRHYKRAEILDESGELRPGCRIVAKGETYERRCFGAVDPTFSHKGWLKSAKSEWLLPLRNGELQGDIEITEFDPSTGMLPQQHVGKRAPEETRQRIEAYNQDVRSYNKLIAQANVPQPVANDIQQQVMRAKEKNELLQRLYSRLVRGIQAALADARAARTREEQKRKALEEYKQYADNRKSPIDAQIGRMNWRLQEQLDRAQGTDYAKQNKTKHFADKRKKEGR